MVASNRSNKKAIKSFQFVGFEIFILFYNKIWIYRDITENNLEKATNINSTNILIWLAQALES